MTILGVVGGFFGTNFYPFDYNHALTILFYLEKSILAYKNSI